MTGCARSGYYAQFGKNCSGLQSQEGYSLCTSPLNFGTYDKNNVLPYTINYTLNVQWQPRSDLAITHRLYRKSWTPFGDSDSDSMNRALQLRRIRSGARRPPMVWKS